MGKLRRDITRSVDGFGAGPNQTLEEPLGEGGERLHEWLFRLKSWREQHGLDGGEEHSDSEVVRESLASTGAYIMGRKMSSGGGGPRAGGSDAGRLFRGRTPLPLP